MENPTQTREQIEAKELANQREQTTQELARRTAAQAALDKGKNPHLAREKLEQKPSGFER